MGYINQDIFYLQFLKNKLDSIKVDELLPEGKAKPVYIWGGDEKGILIADFLKKNDVQINGFLDKRDKIIDKYQMETIKPERVICKENAGNIYVICSFLTTHTIQVLGVFEKNSFHSKDWNFPAMKWINEFVYEYYIRKGEKKAEELGREKVYFLFDRSNIGEQVLTLSWIDEWKKVNHIETITLICLKKYQGLPELFTRYSSDRTLYMDDNDIECLKLYVNSSYNKHCNIIAKEWDYFKTKGYLETYSLTPMSFKVAKLGLNMNIKSKYIEGYGFNDIEVQKIIQEYGIEKGKTLILCPYAKSVPMFPLEFWEHLAERYKGEYKIFTNVASDQEKVIRGTGKLVIPLKYMIDVVNYAGKLITLRSGLADLLACGQCNILVLYYITNDETRGWAKNYQLYVNEKESVLYKNAVEVEPEYDIARIVDRIDCYLID